MYNILEFDEAVEIDNFLLNEENFKFIFEEELEELEKELDEGLSPALAKKFSNSLKKISFKKSKMLKGVKDKGNKKISKLKSAGKHKEAKELKVNIGRKSDEIQDQSLEAEQRIRAKMHKAREKADKYNN